MCVCAGVYVSVCAYVYVSVCAYVYVSLVCEGSRVLRMCACVRGVCVCVCVCVYADV